MFKPIFSPNHSFDFFYHAYSRKLYAFKQQSILKKELLTPCSRISKFRKIHNVQKNINLSQHSDTTFSLNSGWLLVSIKFSVESFKPQFSRSCISPAADSISSIKAQLKTVELQKRFLFERPYFLVFASEAR